MSNLPATEKLAHLHKRFLAQDHYPPNVIANNIPSTRDDHRPVFGSENRNKEQPPLGQNHPSKEARVPQDSIPRPILTSMDSITPFYYIAGPAAFCPPSSHIPYEVTDNGIAGPRYSRSTLNTIHCKPVFINEGNIPFALLIQPLAETIGKEEGVSVMDYGEDGPLRCSRCKAWVNPEFIFKEPGGIAICNLCQMIIQVPPYYRAELDPKGQRIDKNERPELSKGVYEFLAPKSFFSSPAVEPSIVILIDINPTSYSLGILSQVLSSLQLLLDYLPEKSKLCVMTYDFASINVFVPSQPENGDIKIVSIPDILAPSIPFPAGNLFLNPKSDRERLETIFQKISEYTNLQIQSQEAAAKTKQVRKHSSLGAALLAGQSLLCEIGGRIMIFPSDFPDAGAGALKPKPDPSLLVGDKERAVWEAQSPFYSDLGGILLAQKISVDLFIINCPIFDLPTVSRVATLTGGSIYQYNYYNPAFDAERLHYDIWRVLTRLQGYDVSMKLRTSQGMTVKQILTSGVSKLGSELQLAALDADKSITFTLQQEDKIGGRESYFQLALLYTNVNGERIIRVINHTIRVLTEDVNLHSIYDSIDVESLLLYLLRRSMPILQTGGSKGILEAVKTPIINMLNSYWTRFGQKQVTNSLLLPDSLKLLPLYLFSAQQRQLLRQLPAPLVDDRFMELLKCFDRPIISVLLHLYPMIYPIHDLNSPVEDSEYLPGECVREGVVMLPGSVPARRESLESNGIYIADDGEIFHIIINHSNDADNTGLYQQIFGVNSIQEISGLEGFPVLETDWNKRINAILEQLRRNKNGFYQTVRIHPTLTPQISSLLIEDLAVNGKPLSDFLKQLGLLIHGKG